MLFIRGLRISCHASSLCELVGWVSMIGVIAERVRACQIPPTSTSLAQLQLRQRSKLPPSSFAFLA